MADYPADLPIRAALTLYFAANGFPADGGYSAEWVTGKFGPIPFAFPNVEARVRAVRFHDLHHIVTGYETDGPGEGEISAWEIAIGCADFWAAWLLNLTGMAIGFLLAPGRVFRAFVRGRHSANLYRRGYDDALLDQPVGEIRAALLPAGASPLPSTRDYLAFALWWTLGLLATLGPVVLLVAGFVALVHALV